MSLIIKDAWERDRYTLTIEKLREIVREGQQDVCVIVNGEYYAITDSEQRKEQ